MAIRNLHRQLREGTRSYVVDVDIEKFFDSVDHERLIEVLRKRISDPRFLRLLKKLLRTGVMAEGGVVENIQGTPQGSIVSPILANIYLHDVLDQWFKEKYQNHYQRMVRYADDVIFCFKRREDAEVFYHELKKRMEEGGLRLNEAKSRIVSFPRGGHNVFHFLGFTFYWGRDRKKRVMLKLKTQAERLRKSIQMFKIWIKENRSRYRLARLWEMAKAKLQGHYAYYGVERNFKVGTYYYICVKVMFKWLNRRSQKRSMSWDKFLRRLKRHPLPKPWACEMINISQGVLDYAV